MWAFHLHSQHILKSLCSASEALVFVDALWHIEFQMCKSHGRPWLLVEISTSLSDSILWIWCCGLITSNCSTELGFWGCFKQNIGSVMRSKRKKTSTTKVKSTFKLLVKHLDTSGHWVFSYGSISQQLIELSFCHMKMYEISWVQRSPFVHVICLLIVKPLLIKSGV